MTSLLPRGARPRDGLSPRVWSELLLGRLREVRPRFSAHREGVILRPRRMARVVRRGRARASPRWQAPPSC
eukprot:11185635-Lingulodinium_polyedra.AAC.1